MLPHFSLPELLVLLVVVLLLVGPQRLPDLAASIGKSLKLFKQSLRDEDPPEVESKREEE